MLNILVPENLGKPFIKKTMKDIDESCKKYGISIIGGHTEITQKHKKPFLTATIIGESNKLFSIKNVKKDDLLLLIGNPALEGTYILYNAHKEKLTNLLTKEEKKEINTYINQLSVYNYSKIVRKYSKYMHDPTEGGIWGGLSEIDDLLPNLGVTFKDNISLPSPVKKITDYFGINPLKLISSVASKTKKKDLINKLKSSNYPYTLIGSIEKSSDFKRDYTEKLWDYL
jgi:hydrogenase maturation factor